MDVGEEDTARVHQLLRALLHLLQHVLRGASDALGSGIKYSYC